MSTNFKKLLDKRYAMQYLDYRNTNFEDKTMQARNIYFTVQELNSYSDDGELQLNEFSATLYPNGSVSVSYENCNDAWFESVEAVETCGNAEIVAFEIGETFRTSRAAIRESLKGSVKEFGSSKGTRKGFALLK